MWRFIDTGRRSAPENIALDEALLRSREEGASPDTLRLMQFSPPAVLVGYHQSVEEEVRVQYCNSQGIDICRRITGGGAIFLDESQVGWEVVCDRTLFGSPALSTEFFERLCYPVIFALKRFGIEASFRPRNDIEVGGKKISGTGGTTGSRKQDIILFQGTLLVDFDVETMVRALRVPVEKLRRREIESLKERVTCLRRLLGHAPPIEEIKENLIAGFERAFETKLESGKLIEEEERLFESKKEKFKSAGWVGRVRAGAGKKSAISCFHVTDGGIIKVTSSVNMRRGYIESSMISGDFFVHPTRTIYDLEAALKNTPLSSSCLENRIRGFFRTRDVRMSGMCAGDFISAFKGIVERAGMAELGIPLDLTSRIFTVGGTFQEIIGLHPKCLLLPYCAKRPDCSLRYEVVCSKCGDCDFQGAWEMGELKGMLTKTILNFEDFWRTLSLLKSGGQTSYVGCCCEAFVRKHERELARSGIPAILLDINSSTCYELREEEMAYRGAFEGKTEIDLGLLKAVIERL